MILTGTASGGLYSYKHGYGVLDAYAFVNAAQKWGLVKLQFWVITNTTQLGGGMIPKNMSTRVCLLVQTVVEI